MKRTIQKTIVIMLLTLLLASFIATLPVLANPNFNLSVSSVVVGEAPSSDWNYVIKDNSTNNVVANFTLPASGGSIVFPSLPPVGQLYTITQGGVTHFVTPIHGDLPPWNFYAYNASERSGHTPFMEYAKSKIYLYEANGGLTLFIHHNVHLGPTNYVMNMSVTGLPAEANGTYSDDPGDFNYVGGGTTLGFWDDGNTTDGGIVPGLAYSDWNITAQVIWASGISAWEYQTSGGAITLNMSQPLIIRKFTGSLGGDYVITQTAKYGYTTSINVNGTVIDDVFETPVHIGADDTVSVTFINTEVPLPPTPSITIDNVVESVPPDSPWNYIIVDTSTGNVVANFTLPAGGGSISFMDPPFTTGGVFLITATSKRGYTTDISIQTDEGSSSEIDGLQAIVDLAPNGAAVVTFTNAPQSGAFAFAGLGASTPVDWFYNIPPRQPIPVQSACPISIDGDNFVDLVRGKPMVILVNLTGLPEKNGQVSVRFDGGTIYTKAVTADNITNKCVISFPTIVPTVAGKGKLITGNYTLGGESGVLTTTTVSVKATQDLKLYFVWLDNTAYGHVDPDTFYKNVKNITAFINATYPVKNVTVYASYDGKSVTGTSGPFSTLAAGKTAIETDCTAVRDAKSKYSLATSTYTIGIGICPNNTAVDGKPDYFAHKGTALSNYSGAVGFAKWPIKGVVMLDGYYGSGAHEVAHTFKLYVGIPEQYQGLPYNVTGGMPSNGVWAQQEQWRTGISFMGLIEKGSLNTTWEDNIYTYKNLFRNLTMTAGDPEILQAEGLITKDHTVEFTTDWYHTMGTPDTIDPGSYSLKFLDANNQTLNETSFDAQFFDNIDPGVSMGQNIIEDPKFGTVESETAAFSFAVEYPEGTAKVQIIDNTDPTEPYVMETVYAEDIQIIQGTKAYFTDSDFVPINSFDCLFTPIYDGVYKMTATNPATFYYNLQIRNPDPTGLFTITVQIPSDFDLKPLSPRANPVHVNGKPTAYSFSTDGMLTVSNIEIDQNELVTLSVHLDYKLKGGSQLFPSSARTTYSKAYDFIATLNSAEAPTATITAVGKKVTAIGGLIRDLLGEPKGGLTVTVTTKSGSVVGTDISPSDGFYFIAVPPGTYTVRISNSFGTLLTQATNVKVAQDQFVEKNFRLLLSTLDAAIMGFVKDDFGNSVPGVTVKLLKSNTVLATTTTNLGGYYVFRFYLPGQYTVQITVPPGYTATTTSKTVWINIAETEIVNFNLTPI